MVFEYSFFVFGHENISATHKNTFEFTKDVSVSKAGDCILGVNATFDSFGLSKFLSLFSSVEMVIEYDGKTELVDFTANSEFSSSNELVIRRSNFPSERTFGIRASKTAIEFNRDLIKFLQNSSSKVKVTLRPKIKLFIFDLDDTLEDFKPCYDAINFNLAYILHNDFGVDKDLVVEKFKEIDHEYSVKGAGNSPEVFDRELWFKELLSRLDLIDKVKKIDTLDNYITLLVDEYWRVVSKKAKLFPGARRLLKLLYKNFNLVLLSDADSSKSDDIKIGRVVKLGIKDAFEEIITGNKVGQNKPSKKLYDYIFKKFNVSADECVMVGDKPEVDLKLAKTLGMKTIHVNRGVWMSYESAKHFDCVDIEVKKLKELFPVKF